MTVRPDPTTTNQSAEHRHEPEAQTHRYDRPTPTARAFLEAVMHDRSTPLHLRIAAADTLLRIFGPDAWPDPPAADAPVRLTYQIGGIKPQ